MEIFESLTLGIVQGVSEFLPVSSSAHLVIIPWLFAFTDPGLAFDVALHIGTLFAVLAFFWRDWVDILKIAFLNFKKIPNKGPGIIKNVETKYPKKMVIFILIATLPGVFFGYFFESYAENAFRNPLLIASNLSVVGLILFLVDRRYNHQRNLKNINVADAFIIGLSQAFAIIPGVSRSGATITAGLWRGFSRVEAAKFSFLISTPIIFGAAVKETPAILQLGINSTLILGFTASFVSGYLSIKYLLKLVSKVSYAPFFWYRLIFASIVLLTIFFRN